MYSCRMQKILQADSPVLIFRVLRSRADVDEAIFTHQNVDSRNGGNFPVFVVESGKAIIALVHKAFVSPIFTNEFCNSIRSCV